MPNSLKTQSQRRDAIKTLLMQGPAENQQAVVRALEAEGFEATQSSVSRDLRELGAVKTGRGYALPNATDNTDEVASVVEFLRKITAAGPNLTVIETAIGAAQRVALALDRSDWPEVIGNIGGDDTVFVATDTAASQKILISKLERARAV